MKILEIAFSMDWFLTVPGILITCGVALLIIALIIFIAGSMKGKRVIEPAVLEETSENVESMENIVEESVITNEEEIPSIEPVISDIEIEKNNEEEIAKIDEVIPSFETIEPSEEMVTFDTIEPVKEEISEPIIDEEKTMVLPRIEPIEEPSITFEEPKQEIEIPIIEEVSTDEINVEPKIEEIKPRPIYGGADPLEATQNLPKIDVHHEPYSGGLKEVSVVEPIIETPTIEPIVEPEIIPMDSIEEIPEIVTIPDNIEEL